MTNLADLERRLRDMQIRMRAHDLYRGDPCIEEAADLIATLRQMGEGLPEPSMKYQHTFMGKHTDYFTREQMIQYGAKQREVALEALQFYADKNNWSSPSTGFALQYDPVPAPVQSDRGEKARAALKGKQLVGMEVGKLDGFKIIGSDGSVTEI